MDQHEKVVKKQKMLERNPIKPSSKLDRIKAHRRTQLFGRELVHVTSYFRYRPLTTRELEKVLKGENSNPEVRISPPPGASLLRISELVFSKKVFEEIFKPIVADMQHEYIEALAEGRHKKAKWIEIRGWVSFVMALIQLLPVSLFKRCEALWRITR